MEVIHGFDALPERAWPKAVVALGNFDGVHLGHQEILREAVNKARAVKGTSICVSFWPHPAKVLHPERPTALLQTLAQKIESIEALGLEVLIIQPFTTDFSHLQYDVFFRDVLLRSLKPAALRVGSRFFFGHDRRGNAENLKPLCEENGVDFFGIPEFKREGEVVSSSRIRRLLQQADLAHAAELLGRPYLVRGRVVHGQQRGRDLGFPTANLLIENERLTPRGVYACRVQRIPGKRWENGVANWGVRPTIEGADAGEVLEVHLFAAPGDLYGAVLDVELVQHLRPEKRFTDLTALREQIGHDCEQAKACFSIKK